MDLFAYKVENLKKKEAPLADRMRPETLDEIAGQKNVVGPGSALRGLLASDEVSSMIFWGPPGVGKTTLARVIARTTRSRFVALSATSSGVVELRKIVAEAEDRMKLHTERTIVFIDEIHRWNKAQQDAFLPYVEDGTVTLIGATTENPSFEINSALLSRARVFVLAKLEAIDIETLLARAIADTRRGFGEVKVDVEDGVLRFIAAVADGDARTALNALELAVKSASGVVDDRAANMVRLRCDDVAKLLRRSYILYDKQGEEHYNIISALHKSMRGSDPDAALYWLGRMLEAGEDPLYVARRLVRFASEDVGLADPQALVIATAAFNAAHQLGMPECDVCLAECVAYLAKAPKSIAVYVAYGRVKADIAQSPNDPVPLHIRNAPTSFMKDLGYGKGYVYPPTVEGEVKKDFLPDRLRGKKYF